MSQSASISVNLLMTIDLCCIETELEFQQYLSFEEVTYLELNCVIYSTENTEAIPVLVIKYNLTYEMLKTSNRDQKLCVSGVWGI